MLKHIKYSFPFLIAFIYGIWLTGCITEKQRLKICSGCAINAITKDSIFYKRAPFDTALFISQNGQDIVLPYAIECMGIIDSLNYLLSLHQGTMTTNNKGIVSSITRTKGRLVFSCKADSLQYLLNLSRLEKTQIKTIIREIKQACPKCEMAHKTGFDNFLRWLFYICGTLLIIRNLPRIFKAMAGAVGNFR